jgi:hypothetical protein
MTLTRVFAGFGMTAVVAASVVFLPEAAFSEEKPLATPIVKEASDGAVLPDAYPFQPDLRVVADKPDDKSLDRGLTPYDEIAPKLNALMDTSDRISTQVVGQSTEGRDIYLVTVTAPESQAETAQQTAWRAEIKNNAEVAATDAALMDGYKVPIWFNGNIHGNEWEGADAILDYIDDLVTAPYEEVANVLENNRLYFTVTNNPDGRANGTRATAQGFDPNRDFITGATNEASITRDLAPVIQPTFFIDIHGYTGVLQIEPCGPPHGENYEYDLFLPHAYDAALAMEKAVVEANVPGNTYLSATGDATTENTGKINIPYRDIRSGWDDWPPIFAPQYVAYQGAITNTVELPLGRVNNNVPQGTANAQVDVAVAGIVIDTAIDYVVENSSPLLSNQIEIFRRGEAGDPLVEIPADIDPATVPAPNQWAEIWDETDVYAADFPRAYVIPVGASQRSVTDANTLVDQLLVSGVEVQRATTDFTAAGTAYPAGSFVVDMHQPLRGMANVLLADGSDITERVPDMYDISAWSLALLWGADVDAVGSTTDPALQVDVEVLTDTPATGVVPDSGSYLELATAGVAEYQAINALLDAGVPVSQFADGSVIITADGAGREQAARVADAFGVMFVASDGARLLSEQSTGLSDLKVGYTGSQDDKYSLLKLGFTDLVPVTAATIASGEVDLTTVQVLWLGASLQFTPAEQAGTDAVTAYLAEGKGVAGKGTAIASFANAFGLVTTTATTGVSGSNGIVSVDTPASGLLGTYPMETAFVSPAVWYTALGENATVEQSYASEETFIAGHWANAAGRSRVDAAGQASVVSATGPTGSKVVMFGTSVNYRTHPVGSFSQVARALLWAGPVGAEVPAPAALPEEPAAPTVPVEPTTPGAVLPEPGTTPAGSSPSGSAPTSTNGAGGELAATGIQSGLPLGAGALLLMAGAASVLIVRRRRLGTNAAE